MLCTPVTTSPLTVVWFLFPDFGYGNSCLFFCFCSKDKASISNDQPHGPFHCDTGHHCSQRSQKKWPCSCRGTPGCWSHIYTQENTAGGLKVWTFLIHQCGSPLTQQQLLQGSGSASFPLLNESVVSQTGLPKADWSQGVQMLALWELDWIHCLVLYSHCTAVRQNSYGHYRAGGRMEPDNHTEGSVFYNQLPTICWDLLPKSSQRHSSVEI